MINLNDCVEIGLITRPHGIKGQLILKLINLSFEEIEQMEWVFVIIDGLPVPFFIEEFSERNAETLLIKLEDINAEEDARKLSGASAFINKKIIITDNHSQFSFFDRIGYKVIDKTHGYIGDLDALSDNTQNPLFHIKKDRKEILLPLQKEFIDTIDDKLQEINVNCPEGLLEIYL
jgi:16S rRNA processing protein RimM